MRCRLASSALELLDLGAQLVALGLELDAGELGESPQAQLEDVLGLHLAEVEDVHEPGARLLGVVARADDLDDLVDVEDRDEQALDEVQALRRRARRYSDRRVTTSMRCPT